MRNIEIDDDIYEYLRQNTHDIGESATSILRRLLRLGSESVPSITEAPTSQLVLNSPQIFPSASTEISRPSASLGLNNNSWLKGLDLTYSRTAVDRFLAILGAIHDAHKEQFSNVLSLGGRNRRYFGRSEQDITASGSSTHPKRIPGTSYWVITNNDTPKKQRVVAEVLGVLDYPYAERQNLAALVDPACRDGVDRNLSSRTTRNPEDDSRI